MEQKFLKAIEFKENLVKSIFVFSEMVRLDRENGDTIYINTNTGDTDFINASLSDES